MNRIYSTFAPLLISFFFLITLISGCGVSDSPFEDGERYILSGMTLDKDAGVPLEWQAGAEVEIYENWVKIYFKSGKKMIVNRDVISSITTKELDK